jgi:hypothetical protein
MLDRFLIVSVVVVASATLQAVDPPDQKTTPVEYRNPATYEITQRITVTNQDVSALDLLELNLPIPLDWLEQKIGRPRVTGDQTFRLPDVNGLGLIVRSLYREPKVLPGPAQSKSLSLAYRLTRMEIRSSADALAARVYEPSNELNAEYRLYTRSEKLIEADAKEIVTLAAELKAQTKGPYELAKAAYDYVVDHTVYVSPSPSNGALGCLIKGQADCGSYAALFVALCRAGGVPARPVAGCWALGDNQWHCWAEFLLPGVGWIPTDPSVGDRGPKEREYYFGNLDNNRVSLAKTFNLTVKTTKGSTDLGFAQVGTWWWYPAPGSTGSKMVVEHQFSGKKSTD